MSDVVFFDGMSGFVGKESGVILAVRENGNEGLFASRENAPLRWVKLEEFTPDPKGIPSVDELIEATKDDGDDD